MASATGRGSAWCERGCGHSKLGMDCPTLFEQRAQNAPMAPLGDDIA